MFHQIQDSSVVLKSRGVYKQTACFAHNGQVFAKCGSGFIKLFKHLNGTSNPNVSWEDVQLPFPINYTNTGVMLVTPIVVQQVSQEPVQLAA